jgi:hypothetical protein
VYEEATGRRVATVFEREANAPLLATAPELLDACIRARDWLEIENENCYCRELDEGVCLLCELESVINKAGGEP